MKKKSMLQIGCILLMVVLATIASRVDPSSAAFNVLLLLTYLMIPAFIIVTKCIRQPKNQPKKTVKKEEPLDRAA